MFIEINGDILKGIENVRTCEKTLVLHGCNCFHTMNSGIARYLRDRFPVIYDIDCCTTEKGDQSKLGTYSRAAITDRFSILNCYTQYKFGRDGVYADYKAIDRCFDMVSHNIASDWKIRMPRIGCGLAGGEWDIVKELIKNNLSDFNVEVYYI